MTRPRLMRVYAPNVGMACVAEVGEDMTLCERPYLPVPAPEFPDDPALTWCETCRILADLPEARIRLNPDFGRGGVTIRGGRRIVSYLVSHPILPGRDGVIGWTPEKPL